MPVIMVGVVVVVECTPLPNNSGNVDRFTARWPSTASPRENYPSLVVIVLRVLGHQARQTQRGSVLDKSTSCYRVFEG